MIEGTPDVEPSLVCVDCKHYKYNSNTRFDNHECWRGRVKLGYNAVTGEDIYISKPKNCFFERGAGLIGVLFFDRCGKKAVYWERNEK